MEEELKEIKDKLNAFVNKYHIEDISIYISENIIGHKTVYLKLEVWYGRRYKSNTRVYRIWQRA